MSYEAPTAITPISTLPAVTLDQWLSKRDAWLESTEILVRLWFENGLGSRADLARHLGMAKSTITHHCNKLIDAGFTAIPSSKGQGKRRDLQQSAPVQEAEVIDISSTVELPQQPVELKLSKAQQLLATTKARKKDLAIATAYADEQGREAEALARISNRNAELEEERDTQAARIAELEKELKAEKYWHHDQTQKRLLADKRNAENFGDAVCTRRELVEVQKQLDLVKGQLLASADASETMQLGLPDGRTLEFEARWI